MPERGGSFLVEDFLDAITAQLDQAQDALALKARNRPLTYAVKDFAMELKVFVEMTPQGKVMLRPAGPQEEGASRIELGFTTITRPMIEENTVSLNVFNSPSLEELGLDVQERRRLSRLGVRNAAELKRLRSNIGVHAISRLSGVQPVRIVEVIERAGPVLERVEPVKPRHPEIDLRRKPEPKPERRPGRKPPLREGGPVLRPEPPGRLRPGDGLLTPRPPHRLKDDALRPSLRRAQPSRGERTERRAKPREALPVVRLAPGVSRLRLSGRNLIGEEGPPRVRLNNQPLDLVAAEEDLVVFDLPEGVGSGELQVELPDRKVMSFQLAQEPAEGAGEGSAGYDPWAPREETA